MSPVILLLVYCIIILLSSLAGGWIPMLVRLTHRRMEIALSFVSGVMLGVALMHLLPHAIHELGAHAVGDEHGHAQPALQWMLGGFLTMFFIERFFCFHHHDVPDGRDGGDPEAGSRDDGAGCGHAHRHGHSLAWSGAAVGLTLHTLIAGIALAASVESHHHEQPGAVTTLAGLSTFLVIFFHKPFDSLTIGTLMAAGSYTTRARHLVNFLFSLAIPAGVLLFHLGLGVAGATSHEFVGAALAFSAGTFLCISLSDVLPELQFHRHDRLLLSGALLFGLAVSWGISLVEG